MKRVCDYVFIGIFACLLILPFIFANRKGSTVSEQENRMLAGGAKLFTEEGFNKEFPTEYETWFKDNLGFRGKLMDLNGKMLFGIFNQLPDSSETKLGKTGDLIYAPDFIISDYQRTDLWTDEQVSYIAQCYQKVSDYVESTGAQFYYVQCVDKQTIYPERFLRGVNQLQEVSKTDQVMNALDTQTTVKHLYLKDTMMKGSEEYPVFGHWSDATHWTPRGAYLSYRAIMDMLNQYNNNEFKVLDEKDYDITTQDLGTSMYGYHKEDMLEVFDIKDPKAVKKEDLSEMQIFSDDDRHSIMVNDSLPGGKRLLINGDSYYNDFLRDDIAESFGQEWLIWADYTEYLRQAVDICKPDIVIYQAAERVDRSYLITELARQF